MVGKCFFRNRKQSAGRSHRNMIFQMLNSIDNVFIAHSFFSKYGFDKTTGFHPHTGSHKQKCFQVFVLCKKFIKFHGLIKLRNVLSPIKITRVIAPCRSRGVRNCFPKPFVEQVFFLFPIQPYNTTVILPSGSSLQCFHK